MMRRTIVLFFLLMVSGCGGGSSGQGGQDTADTAADAAWDAAADRILAELAADVPAGDTALDRAVPEDAPGDLGTDGTVPDQAGGDTPGDLPQEDSPLPQDVPGDLPSDVPVEPDVPEPPATCLSDSDCLSSGTWCEPMSATCVECLFDHHCQPGQYCKEWSCMTPDGCATGQDCADPAAPVCDPVSTECVACMVSADCPEAAECIANACVPFDPCGSSKDCPGTEICNVVLGKCVDCVDDTDCAEGSVCQPGGSCFMPALCDSDKDCTAFGMVCDKAIGQCAECMVHEDCPFVYHCAAGTCVLDICSAGSQECDGNAVVTCSAQGDAVSLDVECGPTQSCVASWPSASCVDWVCKAGLSYCDDTAPDTAIECSKDGLDVLSTEDCLASGTLCWEGACLPVVCQDGTVGCDGVGLVQQVCTGKGTTVSAQPCPEASYCLADPVAGTAECLPQQCVPGLPTCYGNVSAVCNANGSGFEPPGTDCGTLGAFCLAGECVPCSQTETCDSLDNNCNGLVDESTVDCPAPGLCHAGQCFTIQDPRCKLLGFGAHAYAFCANMNMSWAQAKAFCAGWGGSTLAVPNDKAEQDFISVNAAGNVWIGLSDQDVEGTWEAEACCSAFTYFCDGQPDNWQGNEDCAAANFQKWGAKSGCWNDWFCVDTTKLNELVCETP